VSDLDKEDENDENEKVVEDTNSSNYDVDDLESKISNVGQIQLQIVIAWRCGSVYHAIIQR